jgi:hypothetical protein
VVGNKITVLWDVMHCRSVERLHESKQFLIFICGVTILLEGDMGVYSLNKMLLLLLLESKFLLFLISVFVRKRLSEDNVRSESV